MVKRKYLMKRSEQQKILDKAIRAIMRAPLVTENIGETKISNVSQDGNLLDAEHFREQMRITGCRTKREYVRYMLKLHKGAAK
jgi:hypothetical protein